MPPVREAKVRRVSAINGSTTLSELAEVRGQDWVGILEDLERVDRLREKQRVLKVKARAKKSALTRVARAHFDEYKKFLLEEEQRFKG